MADKIKVSEITLEEEFEMKKKSPYNMPNNPSEKGMKASDIRNMLVSSYLGDGTSLLTLMKRLISEQNIINAELYKVASESGGGSGVSCECDCDKSYIGEDEPDANIYNIWLKDVENQSEQEDENIQIFENANNNIDNNNVIETQELGDDENGVRAYGVINTLSCDEVVQDDNQSNESDEGVNLVQADGDAKPLVVEVMTTKISEQTEGTNKLCANEDSSNQVLTQEKNENNDGYIAYGNNNSLVASV